LALSEREKRVEGKTQAIVRHNNKQE